MSCVRHVSININDEWPNIGELEMFIMAARSLGADRSDVVTIEGGVIVVTIANE